MDATYRSELHALNETNYARFEAKLEQRIAKLANMVTKELLEKKLREQTGLFFAAWGILLVFSIALWFR